VRQKIETPEAPRIHARRLAIVEPVFASLRSNQRLDRFTHRSPAKVGVQWLLYCLVHNIEKVARLSRKYGKHRLETALPRLARPLIGLAKTLVRLFGA
jgi:hypothetical protein